MLRRAAIIARPHRHRAIIGQHHHAIIARHRDAIIVRRHRRDIMAVQPLGRALGMLIAIPNIALLIQEQAITRPTAVINGSADRNPLGHHKALMHWHEGFLVSGFFLNSADIQQTSQKI